MGIYRVMFLCCSGPTPGLDPLCLFISTQNPALYIISPCAGRSVDSSLRVVQRCVILDVYKLPHPYKHVFLSQQLKQAYKPFSFWVHLTHNTKRCLLAVVVFVHPSVDPPHLTILRCCFFVTNCPPPLVGKKERKKFERPG